MRQIYALIFTFFFSLASYALETTDVTVTTTWTQVGTGDTGTLVFQNAEHTEQVGPGADINYAWRDTQSAPSASFHGGLLTPKQSVSRGTETGYLYVKCLSGTRRGALTE